MTVDQASYDALKPVFDRAIEILTKDRGSRGLLWKRLPLSDLIALLHVKSERLVEDSNDVDSADDAINYAAMIAWRIRASQPRCNCKDPNPPQSHRWRHGK